MPMNHLLASVDLGSNSFRLVIGRVVHEAGAVQVYPVERLKETVRLAAGLDGDLVLDEAAIQRAVTVLERFGERLRSFQPDRVRAVATNTFRVAANVEILRARAEAALGFPIEIIAGREEARLVYAGVAHSLPFSTEKRLVVDIGGGSTEFIIGSAFAPEQLESLHMGCVSYSRQFFPDGAITAERMKRAELAARRELETISKRYRKTGWTDAYGSSGTAKALAAIIPATGLSSGGMTRDGLARLKDRLIRAGRVATAELLDIKADRADVLPGGLAIMRAIFDELDIDVMQAADGALRVGVLYDLLGRDAAQDARHDTVAQFMVRHEIDTEQAYRVRDTALALHGDLYLSERAKYTPDPETQRQLGQLLGWAACFHELGLSIAHSGYQRHTAYILEHADMPGFSKSEQKVLATLCLGHRGKLGNTVLELPSEAHWHALFCLRLAAVLHRRREPLETLPLSLQVRDRTFQMQADRAWLLDHPLTDYSLHTEQNEWRKTGFELELTEV